MIKILPLNYLLYPALVTYVLIVFFLIWLKPDKVLFSIMITACGYTVTLITFLVTVLQVGCVWDTVWKYGLSQRFPYVNGEYDVEIKHNWPRLKAIRDGMPDEDEIAGISLGKLNLLAKIHIGLFSSQLELWTDVQSNRTAIHRSRVIGINLLPAGDGRPHQLMYIFRQENNIESLMPSDVDTFYGAAIVDVETDGSLKGKYWSNRNWQQGYNTAGTIVFKRKQKSG